MFLKMHPLLHFYAVLSECYVVKPIRPVTFLADRGRHYTYEPPVPPKFAPGPSYLVLATTAYPEVLTVPWVHAVVLVHPDELKLFN